MKFIKGNIFKELIPVLTVLLWAIYPIFALYAHNVDELLLKQLFLPIIFSLVFASIFFGLWLITLKDNLKASFATVLLLVIFWNYGLIFMGIINMVNIKHWHLIPVVVFIYFYLVFFINRIKRYKSLNNLNTILLWPILLLNIINVITILPTEFKKVSIIKKNNKISLPASEVIDGKFYPDIYLIILDEFASLKTIKEEWGYNNDSFADFLRDKGFFVTENSESRYNQTILSISSLLNIDYVTGPIEKSSIGNFLSDPESVSGSGDNNFIKKTDFNEVMQKLNNNFFTNYLKEHGYKLHVLEGISQHQSSFKIHNTDSSFAYQELKKSDKPGSLVDAFYLELIKKTIIKPFDMFFNLNQTYNINYLGTKYIVNYLKKPFNHNKTPKFIYAHIMCPHGPFVFDRGGNYSSPITPDGQRIGGFVSKKNTVNDAYLDQYIYICDEIKNIVNSHIQKNPSVLPVIIIQSDHGPRPFFVYLKDRMNSFKVFNAVYFPDGDYRKLYDSIAPINTMRVVLNKYFGENFKMLEDK